LNNLKESVIQFTKPRKLVNRTNPGGRFMSNTMFDAREALIAPGMYTNRPVRPHLDPVMDNYYRTHDRMNFFPPGPEQARNAFAANIPIPVGMFMSPMPPPTYQFNHQAMTAAMRPGNQPHRQRMPMGGHKNKNYNNSNNNNSSNSNNSSNNNNNSSNNNSNNNSNSNSNNNNSTSTSNTANNNRTTTSQELSQGPLSQGPLSQGPLTQGGMSQQMHPLSQPLSQPELSQDSYLGDDFHLKSQADQVLSQDSSYQGDRGGYHPFSSQAEYSQPIYNSQYWIGQPPRGGDGRTETWVIGKWERRSLRPVVTTMRWRPCAWGYGVVAAAVEGRVVVRACVCERDTHEVPVYGWWASSEFSPNDKEATDGKLLYGSVSVKNKQERSLFERRG